MKQLLRRMSAAELQELVDLVAGCTCSTVTSTSKDSISGEKLVQTETKEYFDTIIFNVETITNSVKSYKQSIEEYVLEKDRDYAELLLELSSLRELESKGYAVEKAAIEKLNKKIKDLSDLIKTKSAGATKKKKPGPTPPKKPGPAAPKKPGPAAPKKPGPTPPKKPGPAAPKKPGPAAGRGGKPAPAVPARPPAPGRGGPRPAPSAAPRAALEAAKIAAGGGAIVAAGLTVKSPFDPMRKHPVYHDIRPHRGTDIVAKTNKPLYSIKPGKVIIASFVKGYGNYVLIEHDDVRSAYAHLSHMNVKKGDTVKQGQLIGKSGSTGVGTGPHLHFEIRKKDKGNKGLGTAIDAETYFKENPEVISPMHSDSLLKTAMNIQYEKESGGGKQLRVRGLTNAETIGGAYHLSDRARLDAFNRMSPADRKEFINKTGFTSSPTLEQLVNKEGTKFLSDKAKLADKMLAEQYTQNIISRLTEKSGGKIPELHDIRGAEFFGPAGYDALLKDAAVNPKMTFGEFYDKHPNFIRPNLKQFHGKTIGQFKSVLLEQTGGAKSQVKPEPITNPTLTQTKAQKLNKQEKTRTVILPVILGYK